MFSVTRYCVQEFLATSAGIRPGEVRQYRDQEAAMREGRRIGGRRVGATIYRAIGEPPSDIWRQPELIEAVGYVPKGVLDLFAPAALNNLHRSAVVELFPANARRAVR
jgi:hypothetical protein